MNYSRRQLESFGEPFGDSSTTVKPGGRIYGGGGSPSQPTSTTQTTLSYPAEFRPMVMETAQRAMAEASTPRTAYRG